MYPHMMQVTPISLPECDLCTDPPALASWLIKWSRWGGGLCDVHDVEEYVCHRHLVAAVERATLVPDMPAVELVRL